MTMEQSSSVIVPVACIRKILCALSSYPQLMPVGFPAFSCV